MSKLTTNDDLLSVVTEIRDLYFSRPEGFSSTPLFDPQIALPGTEQEFVRVSGMVCDRHAAVFLRLDADGGLTFSISFTNGQGAYRAEILPQDATSEIILLHAHRAIKRFQDHIKRVGA